MTLGAVAAIGTIGSAAIKVVPAITAGVTKLIPAAAAVGGVVTKVGAATTAVVGIGKLTATIGAAIKTATTIIGIGKLTILPVLIASLLFYNYDLYDPENRPFNAQQVEKEYDFIVIGGGSAGSVMASRLSEIAGWKVLLLEAGGQETEITDVPILSLYLHKSKLDWKYRY